MKLSREEVLHIALLARLGLTEDEVDRFREQLSNILENFEILQQVDTSDIPPTAQSIDLQNVVKGDEVTDSLSQSEILANAPRKDGEFFRVRPVLEWYILQENYKEQAPPEKVRGFKRGRTPPKTNFPP